MTGRYKAYPEYKSVDANITIPMGWNYCQAKRYLTVQSGDMLPAARVRDSGTPVVGGNGYRGFTDSANTKANTIVIGRVGAKCGCVHTIKEDFWASEHAFKVISRKQYNMSFMAYLLESLNLNQYAITTAQPLLNTEIVTSKHISLPNNLVEQQKIANFLDHETAKIDTLIAKQEKLIELLKEKRQAVISHAVTKGLNPQAPMKDSGVEWLGEVPEHWDVTKFGYISQVVRGGSPRPAGDPELFNGDYSPWVTVAEITKDDEIYLTETETFLTKKGSLQCRVFTAGTLLLSNSGATLGVPSILSINANANDGVVGFENLKVNSEFAYFYLSSLTQGLRDRIKQGSGQPNLNTDIVKSISIPLPPSDEIEKIVEYIHKLRAHYRQLESKAIHGITLLKERKTALISAAVTGKIDVRDWEFQGVEG
ncbi:restriction endonuclease subunit S [Vibrio cholerae]